MISSLVSFSRRAIHEEIPGMQNAIYNIPPSPDNKTPSILHVEDSFHYKPDIDGNQDRVIVPSSQIVTSIAHMHVTSQLGYRADRYPAFFAIVNEAITIPTLFAKYKKLVDEALARQATWYRQLVQIADDDWQQLRRHNMISDVQRTAARELGLEREWIVPIDLDSEKPACPFCGTGLLDKNAPICPNCGKVHNPSKLAELEKSFAITTK